MDFSGLQISGGGLQFIPTVPAAPTINNAAVKITAPMIMDLVRNTGVSVSAAIMSTKYTQFTNLSFFANGTDVIVKDISLSSYPITVDFWYYSVNPSADTTAGIMTVYGQPNGSPSVYEKTTIRGGYFNQRYVNGNTSSGLRTNRIQAGWNHVAVYISSSRTVVWMNGSVFYDGGVLSPPFTLTTAISNLVLGDWGIDLDNYDNPTGYYSEVRVTSGDVYGVSNTSITVPTSVLKPISGTQYLFNFRGTEQGVTVNVSPPFDQGGNAITSYSVTSSPGNNSVSSASSGDFNITGLTAGTTYSFTATATNGIGTSGNSNSVSSLAYKTIPANPTINSVTQLSSSSANIAFTAGNSGGGTFQSQTLFAIPNSGSNLFTTLTSTATTGNITITGLTPGATYTYRVFSATEVGYSPAATVSNYLSAVAPNAPTIGTATVTSGTSANITYTAPADNGGSAITTYTATSSPGGITGTVSQAGSGTIAVSGLTRGTAYTFTVTATNIVGTSAASSASNSITPYSVPGTPTIGTATAISSTSATVTYTAPADNGGLAITSYTAVSSPGGITGTLSQAGSGTITVSGLTKNTAYTFTVYATNSMGNSPSSSSSNSITTPNLTAPAAPTVTAVSSTTSTTAVVTYTAPADNGGATITSYTAVSSPGGLTGTVSQAGSGTITVSGLTSGLSYTFTVYATNSQGNGTSSAASSAITTPGQATWTTAGSYSWICPAGVTSVSIVCVGGGGGGWNSSNGAGGGGGALAYGVATVVPGTSYTVVVGAAGGTGGASYFSATNFLYAGGGGAASGTSSAARGLAGSAVTTGASAPKGGYSGGAGGYFTGTGSPYGAGGGGAGGYAGVGGNGGISSGSSLGTGSSGGSGGAGGGGGQAYSTTNAGSGTGGGGGGVGLFGLGTNGAGGSSGNATSGWQGKGGSGGMPTTSAQSPISGYYGGGGGGQSASGTGSVGAVKLVWGNSGYTRQYPSTNVGVDV